VVANESGGKTLVFCEPPYVFWDRRMDRLREGEETIPGMGVLVLAAVARSRGYRVHLIDAKQQGVAADDVVRQIAALRPDYLGLSATTISVTNAARVAAGVKQLLPDVVTILGGAHVSAIPERTRYSTCWSDWSKAVRWAAFPAWHIAATAAYAPTRALRTSTTWMLFRHRRGTCCRTFRITFSLPSSLIRALRWRR
jgi:B12 binding domain